MKHAIYLKGEFEAEGLEQTEVAALITTSKVYGLKLAIKIGGCEARSDYMFCRKIMADAVIAPMIESPFAAEKLVEPGVGIILSLENSRQKNLTKKS